VVSAAITGVLTSPDKFNVPVPPGGMADAAGLGGNVRTGLEDTFYLPGGERAANHGQLFDALVKIVEEVGQKQASAKETREILGVK